MKCSFNKDEKIKYNNYIKSENINQNLKNFTKLLKKLPSNPVFPPFLIAVSLPLQPFKFRKWLNGLVWDLGNSLPVLSLEIEF